MRPLLFYAAWPLGYHNVEAERKAVRLAEAGYDVVYVTGVGTRNPRLSRLSKVVDRVRRKLTGGGPVTAVPVANLRTAGVAVVPPRQVRAVARLNEWWLERQLTRSIDAWEGAVAWVRWPTQELVTALTRLRPALVVYESVDANHLSPGITGRWLPIFEAAERALVAVADLVVVPGEALAERYRPWGKPVEIVPHGVELGAWREQRSPVEHPTLGFIGTLDYRVDLGVLRRVAELRPTWRLRLIGPVQEGFDPDDLAGLDNVSVEPAVPQADVARVTSTFDVGLLAYGDHPHFRFMAPVKALELLATGTPVVARWNPALGELASHVRFAATPEEYVAQIEAAVAEDSSELARSRRALAAEHSWDRSLDSMCRLLSERLP